MDENCSELRPVLQFRRQELNYHVTGCSIRDVISSWFIDVVKNKFYA